MNEGSPVVPPPSRFAMPNPVDADPGNDVIAVGADLEPGTLLAAYRTGLFPMPVDPGRRRSKIAWYSPDPRGVLPLDGLHVSRSLRRSRKSFETRTDTAFEEVMRACADPTREGRWITEEFISAYGHLHDLGWAHSFEVYAGDTLVGGLYGLKIGRLFAGEAMFHHATDASKVALVDTVERLRATGVTLFDVQWATPHLETLGVVEIPRTEYLRRLAAATDGVEISAHRDADDRGTTT
ncbi:leucyl/phenylalanyl-tRNA--protein transferase [Ilumatobacter nonamiensis]|uniref:leucyl/phenylalanyl-tRNA--protein transferase n=1 Tax=Ilumatobacter nonamiensis TaxID=467093 RepID=UPI000688D6FD|nr:leucyl/phenylalanyl-tRNA--protein transferase [Ilumatobacter nonamiensis]